MIHTVAFKAEDLITLLEEGASPELAGFLTYEAARQLESDRFVWTYVNEKGEIVACMGVREYWPDRGEGWAVFHPELAGGSTFVALHRAMKKCVDSIDYRRLEATVDVSFKRGLRWAELLGFEKEGGVRPFFFPNSHSAQGYVKFNHV